MARIRTIKPEFFSDEKFAPLAAIDRFVFLGLISMADDAGRMVDNVKSIDGFIFPKTEDSCRESLATLARIGRIIRYTSASGQDLIQITKWKEHQKVDKPSKYVLPGPTSAVVAQAVAAARDTGEVAGPSREPPGDSRETVARSSRSDLGPTTYDQLPTTTDQRPKKRSTGKRESLPPAAREFGRVFYRNRGATVERQEEVRAQLLATLNGGAKFRRSRVFAGSPERLEAKCREVIAAGVKDPDKAIVVLLTKLADVGNAADSPTERVQRDVAADVAEDNRVGAERLELAIAWLDANPEIAEEIERQLTQELKSDQPSPIRNVLRNTLVARAWLKVGEPIVQPSETP